MLFLLSFMCVFCLGYLAQSIGLCMVRGVNEWMKGNRQFLCAILLSGLFAWVSVTFAYFVEMPVQYKSYEPNFLFLLGGVLFGLGAFFNQGCGVSTLNKLARGDLKMLATIIGWLAGWLLLAVINFDVNFIEVGSPELKHYGTLLFASCILCVWLFFSTKANVKLWLSIFGIGMLAGFLFLLAPKWTPSSLLYSMSHSLINNNVAEWPTNERFLMFLGLLLGMLSQAYQSSRLSIQLPRLKSFIIHLMAGIAMGGGASLSLGGNDSQLLLAMPSFSIAGFISVIGIIGGIKLGVFVTNQVKSY